MRVPNNSIGLSNPWCRLQLLWFLHWIPPAALQECVCVLEPHPAPPVGLIQPKTAPAPLFPQYSWLGWYLLWFVSPFSLGLQHSPFLTLFVIFYPTLPSLMELVLKNIKLSSYSAFPSLCLPLPVVVIFNTYHNIEIISIILFRFSTPPSMVFGKTHQAVHSQLTPKRKKKERL